MSFVFNYGVEVTLDTKDDFLIVMETLTRIGHVEKAGTLLQECHIFHKRGRYFIVHHNEMKIMNGDRSVVLSVEDRMIRNRVALLLDSWGLVTIVRRSECDEAADMSDVKIVRHEEKQDWNLVPQYRFKLTRQAAA